MTSARSAELLTKSLWPLALGLPPPFKAVRVPANAANPLCVNFDAPVPRLGKGAVPSVSVGMAATPALICRIKINRNLLVVCINLRNVMHQVHFIIIIRSPPQADPAPPRLAHI